jgi:hypothetical protein
MSKCVITIDTASGSDSTSSGAGPGDGYNTGTKLSGTANATADAGGTVVTLPASTVLTDVDTAIAGSYKPVLYFADATAGNRNFSEIVSTAGSGGATPTVTVSAAFGSGVANKDWAIGGCRASLFSTSTRKCWENNSTTGDGGGAWDYEYTSGSSDTAAAVLTQRGVGSTTLGRMVLRTKAGYTTRAVINNTANATTFAPATAAYMTFKALQFTCTNGTKTSSIAIQFPASGIVDVDDCIFGHATNTLGRGIAGAGIQSLIQNSRFMYCTIAGLQTSRQGVIALHNTFDHNAIGINLTGAINDSSNIIVGNQFYAQTVQDIKDDITGTTATNCGTLFIYDNTFDTTTDDCIEITSTSAQIGGWRGTIIENNIFSNLASGKYAVNFSGSGHTLLIAQADGVKLNGNNYYAGAGSGITNLTGLDTNTQTINPSYTSAATLDFSVGTGLKGKRWPTSYIGGSLTLSYGVPGAAQRYESGGGLGFNRSVNGGVQE